MRTTTTRKALSVLAVAAFALALSACNTVSGVGRDLQEASDNTSEAIDNAVND